ncbi:lamin tail domain-containing protein [bacterium]|nr:lamin tail domain-containing protein [bacterium]
MLACLFPLNLFAQVLLTEIFPNPLGSDSQKEFVEILNSGTNSINLIGWKISDNSSTDDLVDAGEGLILLPNQFAIILENDYDLATGEYNGIIPDSALIIKVDDSTIGNGLLNSSETITILDNSGNAIDFFTYLTTTEGYTTERVGTSNTWLQSLIQGGTPGFTNSVSPKDKDLALTKISIPESSTQKIEVLFQIKNLGNVIADSFTVEFFVDSLKISEQNFFNLTDSLNATFSKPNSQNGSFFISLKLFWQNDQNPANDTLSIVANVPFNEKMILFSEIFPAPQTGKAEWLEIINNSSQTLNLNNWEIQDAAGGKIPLSGTLESGKFLTFAQNTNFFTDFPNSACAIVPTSWASLNNTSEILVLKDFSGKIIDSLSYETTWEISTGISHERLSLDASTNDANNWKPSLDLLGGTPCFTNSFNGLTFPHTKNAILINEFLPVPTDSNAEWIEFYNNFNEKIDLKGWTLENASGTKVHLSGVLEVGEFLTFSQKNIPNLTCAIVPTTWVTLTNTSGTIILKDFLGFVIDSLTYTSNWKILSGISQERLSYTVATSDSSNWLSSASVENGTPCSANSFLLTDFNFPAKTLVINEVMYSPFTDFSEYAEIFNNSQTKIQLNAWELVKAKPTTKIRFPVYELLPQDFVVFAKDTTFFELFPEAKNKTMILPNFFSLSTADTLRILTPKLEEIDFLAYDSDFGGNTGISIEKINPALENKSENWRSSVRFEGGTPTQKNSVFLEIQTKTEFDVFVLPNPFSPNGDGKEDQTLISWKTNEPNLLVDIKIFDVKGRKIKNLANSENLGGTSNLLWGGKTDKGEKARIGVYVILFEAKTSGGDKILRKKLTVVLAEN